MSMGTDISGIGSYLTDSLNTNSSTTSISKLSNQLENIDTDNSSDEELMNACKEFESYLVEQVVKGMEKTIMKDEDEESLSSYMNYFGDTLHEEYASSITEQSDLGIAKMLYESMKRE